MRTDSLNYLKNVGIDYKSSESPDLWSFLEDHVTRPHRIGHIFSPMSPLIIEDVIARGENALLDAMVVQHLRSGTVDEVTEVVEMPFSVGHCSSLIITNPDHEGLFRLIENPGTAHEHLTHVVAADEELIPCTHRVTVKGGIYADGHTAGYYDLYPGFADVDDTEGGVQAWLATPREISALAYEMEHKLDDIRIISRRECESMILKARKRLNT
jgi:hypothetical protein